MIDTNPPAHYSLEKVIDLPMQLRESSGLLYFDSLFWTFNDGGNLSELYGINIISSKIEKVLRMKDYKQTDWEDITQDSDYIYIGDVGNNYGSRDNLSVVKISKLQLTKEFEQEVDIELIKYSYPDQHDFSNNYRNTSFDCEALVCIGDSLLLFTKDWINYTSTVYQIAKVPGNCLAVKLGTFDTEGLVAAADFNSETNQLILAGYSDYIPFIRILDHFNKHNLYSEKTLNILFEDFSGVKLEGIAFYADSIYVSSEGSFYQQAIYMLTKK